LNERGQDTKRDNKKRRRILGKGKEEISFMEEEVNENE
jgi:hypothetical protein